MSHDKHDVSTITTLKLEGPHGFRPHFNADAVVINGITDHVWAGVWATCWQRCGEMIASEIREPSK